MVKYIITKEQLNIFFDLKFWVRLVFCNRALSNIVLHDISERHKNEDNNATNIWTRLKRPLLSVDRGKVV